MRKRALVTGAARRLGRAMAVHLSKRDFDVAVHFSSSEHHAATLVHEVIGAGSRAVAIQANLLNENETQSLVAMASKALGGPLDCLINNASIFEDDRIDTATRESWDRHIESNLRAPFVLIQNFAKQAPTLGYDRHGEPHAQALIINMLDQRVHNPTEVFMSYTIAKMGLWALTRTAAQALSPSIRVNAIGPGPTLQGTHQSETQFAQERASTILRRGASPEDICAALDYFLNAPSVTGQLICPDGGQHLTFNCPAL
jgi:NAD(P)-dependent dehydrogenase (short-subunit alcohol dehydrogenase family)